MGDSDDEYGDRKRRDKFRGERTESYRSSEGRRDDRRRDDWMERDAWSGGGRSRGRGDFRGAVRERFSPPRQHDFSPPPKRMRPDWEDSRRMPYGGDPTFNSYAPPWGPDSQNPYTSNSPRPPPEQVETQPPMLTLKVFLQSQDDNISDEEAIRKYNEYKLEFRRQQLNEFFVAHKEEEWFKLKYHPEDSVKRKEEQNGALKRRVGVFMEFLETGRLDSVSVDADQSDQLIRLLDAAVIRLEGGTDFDLKILDEPPPVPTPPAPPTSEAETKVTVKKEPVDATENKENETQGAENSAKKENEGAKKEEETKQKSREGSPEPPSKSDEDQEKKKVSPIDDTEPVSLNGGTEDDEEEKPEDKASQESKEAAADDQMSVEEDGEHEEKKNEEKGSKEEAAEKEEKEAADGAKGETKASEDDAGPKPRPLHRTASIFLRNLAPTITKSEVESMCKRYPGFLRVAIADPQPDRRWFRRGWVTFQRDVNIKEICWNLNNIRLRDCELGAIVNRDLSRRIRSVSGLTTLKQVVRHDLKLGAKIIQNLDLRSSLWQSDGKPKQQQSFGLISENPVLANITDYLIEEASAEEEELLGQGQTTEAEQDEQNDRDQAMIKVLDRLLLYLRIVHSVDYYNHCEYPNEDEMPNRCGIMHARGSAPTTKVTSQEVQDYCRGFAQKMACLMSGVGGDVEGADLAALGAKHPDQEVEKFVSANTQELAKDKWLCPLSGKKFKGPEFVKKHIFNKHAEKIEEVKKEVEYFNNYLRDPKRPMLPEHPGNRGPKKEAPPDQMPPPYGYGYGSHRVSHPYPAYGGYGGGRGYQHYGGGGGYGGYPGGFSRGPGRGGFPRGGRGMSDYRPVIHYRDLDAPREPDEFI